MTKQIQKIHEFGLNVPIYDDYIIIQDHKDNIPKDMKENMSEFADAGFWRDEKGQLHIWLSKNLEPWRTIPHECLHIANRILAERNVIYYPEQDEALAYLVGFLCHNVSSAYFELYKKN